MAGFRVFLSYKHEDGGRVAIVQRALRAWGAKYLRNPEDFQVFMARDPVSLASGLVWRHELDERLVTSDWFILFYTTPNADWQWCLYEAGVFATKFFQDRKNRRLVCLTPPGVPPPAPLENLQTCQAEEGRLRDDLIARLLDRLKLRDVDAAEQARADAEQIVRLILDVFNPYAQLESLDLLRPRALLPCMIIRAPLELLSNPDKLIESAVVSFRGDAHQLFHVAAGAQLRFTAFAELIPDRQAWLADLRRSIRQLATRPGNPESHQVMIDAIDGAHYRHVYRPVFTDVRTTAQCLEIEVCFVELLTDPDLYAPGLNRCFKLHRICHSFRVQVVEPLLAMKGGELPVGERHRLDRTLDNIISHYRTMGLDSGVAPLIDMDADPLPQAGELIIRAIALWKAYIGLGHTRPQHNRAIVKAIARALDVANGAYLNAASADYAARLRVMFHGRDQVDWDAEIAAVQSLLNQVAPRPIEDDGDHRASASSITGSDSTSSPALPAASSPSPQEQPPSAGSAARSATGGAAAATTDVEPVPAATLGRADVDEPKPSELGLEGSGMSLLKGIWFLRNFGP